MPLASQMVPLGPEFRVNEADIHALEAPALAFGASGRLLAVWPGPFDGDDGTNDLLLRLFERDGRPAGPVTVIPGEGEGNANLEPEVVTLPSGRFALAWEDVFSPVITAPTRYDLSLRILDADGALLVGEQRIDTGPGSAVGVRIAARPSGGLIATWIEDGTELKSRLFAAGGQPEGDPRGGIGAFFGSLANDAVAALDDGGFLAFWYSDPFGSLPPSHLGARLDAAGEPLDNIFNVANGLVAVGRDGRFAAAWSGQSAGAPLGSSFDARLALYGSDGRSLGPDVIVADGEGDQAVQAAGMDEHGRILVVWSNETPQTDAHVDGDLSARLFAADGAPLGPAFPVATNTAGDQLGVRVIGKGGDWVISWVTEPGAAGGGNLFTRRFTTCAPEGSLCLGGRFRAEVAWKVPGTGQTGAGQAVPLTGDTGAFWFFSPENLELVVKALDGSALNGHYWVFYGALSDVEYDLTVTDTVTGERKVYHNQAGTMASRADTRAFAAGDELTVPAASLPEPVRKQAAPLTPPPCGDGPENLCLGFPWLQYRVEVDWRIPATGQTGRGKAVRLTGETGYFWFFDDSNVELMVKILDGTAINGRHWVFYGALSDVEYTITVTNKLNGQVKTYHNPAGTLASRADTAAFTSSF